MGTGEMKLNQSVSVGAVFDCYLSKTIKEILDQTKFPPEPEAVPETLEEIVRNFLIIHIRFWHIEDSMAQTKSDIEFIDYLSQADAFAKGKRPQLKALLDKFMLQLCHKKVNNRQLIGKEEK